MTTPSTSAQGPVAGWRYSINYGPDGEENYANVYAADGQFVGNLRTHHAIAICNALASPSPAASPGLDVVALREKIASFIDENAEVRGDHPSDFAILVNADELAASIVELLPLVWLRASLASDATPAPTSGYEDASPYDDAVQGDKMLMELLNAAVDENIRLRAALAKPASEPAGGDVDALRKAAEEFCRRVEAGEIRSKRSYAAFKAALSSSAGPAVEPVATIGFYENEREPRLLSWNKMPNGEHHLYAHPAPATVEMREADIARWKRDSELLSAIQDECWDVRFTSTPNADAGDYNVNIEIVSHFMAEPQERVVGENYNENLRAALEQAMTADAYPPARPVYDLPAALAPATEGRKG